jgi:hypothetical protein
MPGKIDGVTSQGWVGQQLVGLARATPFATAMRWSDRCHDQDNGKGEGGRRVTNPEGL